MLYSYFEMSSSNKEKELKIHELICSNLLLGFMSHERIIGVNLFPNKLWACNDSNKIIINKIWKAYQGKVFLHDNLLRSPKSFSEIPTFSGDWVLCWDSRSGEAGTLGGKASRLVARCLGTSTSYCGHCFLEYKHFKSKSKGMSDSITHSVKCQNK